MSMSNKTETEIQKRKLNQTNNKPNAKQNAASSAGMWEEGGAWHAEIGN